MKVPVVEEFTICSMADCVVDMKSNQPQSFVLSNRDSHQADSSSSSMWTQLNFIRLVRSQKSKKTKCLETFFVGALFG